MMASGEIELTFDPWGEAPLAREPATVGVPFPPGALPSPAEACLYDGDAELYCQRQVLASWPDGSVRWLLLDFQVDLPARSRKTLRLACAAGPSKAVLDETGISLAEDPLQIILDNGPLRILSRKRPFLLFESVLLNGAEVLSARESPEFRVVDLSGRAYTSAACQRTTVTLEASGPLRAAVRFEGSHLDEAGHPLLDFSILLTTWSDKPYAAVDYQIIHRRGAEPIELHEVAFHAAFTPRGPVRLVADPLGHSPAPTAELAPARVHIPGPSCPGPGNPEVWLAAPWVGRAEGGRGLAVGLRHAHLQFPKLLIADRGSLCIGFYPAGDAPLRLYQGAAKTHQALFQFYAEPSDPTALARRFRLFNLAPRPRLPVAWYAQAQAFGGSLPGASYPLDALLDEAFDRRPRALGLLHFGDEPHPDQTDPCSDSQDIVWSNNTYDLAHALFLHYARTGQRRHFAAAEAIVRHVLDVDHIHFSLDPLRDGGLAGPDLDHCRNGYPHPGHQWVEGLLDYYHLTGSPPALLAARRVGENVLRHVPELLGIPPAETHLGEVGGALGTLAILHRELGKPQYAAGARRLFDHLAACSTIGAGLAELPTIAAFGMGSLAAALAGLARYHQAASDPRAAEFFLRELNAFLAPAADDPWRGGPTDASSPDPYEQALLLDPLAYAHELTREARYLGIGAPLVCRLLRGPLLTPRRGHEEQRLIGDAFLSDTLLVPATGFDLARLVGPLFAYLAAAEAAGLLDRLGLGR